MPGVGRSQGSQGSVSLKFPSLHRFHCSNAAGGEPWSLPRYLSTYVTPPCVPDASISISTSTSTSTATSQGCQWLETYQLYILSASSPGGVRILNPPSTFGRAKVVSGSTSISTVFIDSKSAPYYLPRRARLIRSAVCRQDAAQYRLDNGNKRHLTDADKATTLICVARRVSKPHA